MVGGQQAVRVVLGPMGQCARCERKTVWYCGESRSAHRASHLTIQRLRMHADSNLVTIHQDSDSNAPGVNVQEICSVYLSSEFCWRFQENHFPFTTNHNSKIFQASNETIPYHSMLAKGPGSHPVCASSMEQPSPWWLYGPVNCMLKLTTETHCMDGPRLVYFWGWRPLASCAVLVQVLVLRCCKFWTRALVPSWAMLGNLIA